MCDLLPNLTSHSMWGIVQQSYQVWTIHRNNVFLCLHLFATFIKSFFTVLAILHMHLLNPPSLLFSLKANKKPILLLYLFLWQKDKICFHLFCPGLLQQFNDWGDGVAPDDGVINQHHPFVSKVVTKHPKLLSHTQLTQACVWLDECPPHVAVLAQDFHIWQARLQHRQIIMLLSEIWSRDMYALYTWDL